MEYRAMGGEKCLKLKGRLLIEGCQGGCRDWNGGGFYDLDPKSRGRLSRRNRDHASVKEKLNGHMCASIPQEVRQLEQRGHVVARRGTKITPSRSKTDESGGPAEKIC